MKTEFRILQYRPNCFVVQSKSIWFLPWLDMYSDDNLATAERHLFIEMQIEEERQFVPRVVGDPVEYELRYLKQRIADISKL